MATKNLTAHKGQCINFGNCNKANTKEIIEVNIGDDFVCPECDSTLEVQSKKTFPIWIIIALVAVTVLGSGGYLLYTSRCNIPVVKDFCDCPPLPLDRRDTIISHPITPDGITLDKTSLSFETAGETVQLAPTVLPNDVDEKNKEVIWKSGDEAVATVSSTGLVTAVATGSAVISVYTGNGISATCYVTVGGGETIIDVVGITLDKTALSLKEGAVGQLDANVIPYNATNKELTWSSDNTAVATVTSTGLVTALVKGLVKGKTNIIVATVEGGKSDTCVVTVGTPPIPNTISVSGGTYKGELKKVDGKYIPDGMGTIYYNVRTQICSSDPKKRCAEAGQYIVGQFRNGSLLQGRLYDSKGNHIETIICGGGAH